MLLIDYSKLEAAGIPYASIKKDIRMATTLYRAGGLRTIRGVLCEMRNFEHPEHYLKDGWFYSPGECYAEEETETDGILTLDHMTDDEIRILAKEKKIKNWYNKGIYKLKVEIDAWQPEI